MKSLPLLACAVLCFAQSEVVFRSGVSLVRVDAEAIDATGRVVPGLTKDDFRVLDEGEPQLIGNFSFAEDPLDLILLFDTAGSMHGKLLNVVRATELGFDELHKGDRVSVRAFGNSSTEVLPFTENLQAVNEAILIQVLQLRFGGKSRLEPAADEAAQRLRREPDTHHKRAILVVTDNPGPTEANLRNSDIVLSELLIGGKPHPNPIVDKTGGATIVAGNPGEAFRDSVHYLRSGYTMYYSQPAATPGAQRRLQVELTPEAAKRFPGVQIRSRSGYIAP